MRRSTDIKKENIQVTFVMPAMKDCGCSYLVGWFNEWDENVYRMQQTGDGLWSLTLELQAGCEYHYGFRTNDGTWLHDPDLPSVPNPNGFQNSFFTGGEELLQ